MNPSSEYQAQTELVNSAQILAQPEPQTGYRHTNPQIKAQALQALLALLQRAHAGELAAARAYQGHAASWWARRERSEIEAIEAEEWRHRADVGKMLASLGGQPIAWREKLFWLIGSSIGLLCHMGGWLIPMYGAGVLEQANFEEYEAAARLARAAGHPELVEVLLEMAETEWDHEAWFRARVMSHRIGRRLPLWSSLPPRSLIRSRFAASEDKV